MQGIREVKTVRELDLDPASFPDDDIVMVLEFLREEKIPLQIRYDRGLLDVRVLKCDSRYRNFFFEIIEPPKKSRVAKYANKILWLTYRDLHSLIIPRFEAILRLIEGEEIADDSINEGDWSKGD